MTILLAKTNSGFAHPQHILTKFLKMFLRRCSRDVDVVQVWLPLRNRNNNLLNDRLKDCWSARKAERETINAIEALVRCEN